MTRPDRRVAGRYPVSRSSGKSSGGSSSPGSPRANERGDRAPDRASASGRRRRSRNKRVIEHDHRGRVGVERGGRRKTGTRRTSTSSSRRPSGAEEIGAAECGDQERLQRGDGGMKRRDDSATSPDDKSAGLGKARGRRIDSHVARGTQSPDFSELLQLLASRRVLGDGEGLAWATATALVVFFLSISFSALL